MPETIELFIYAHRIKKVITKNFFSVKMSAKEKSYAIY